MSGPELLPAVADTAGLVLAFVLAWAALFFVGPVACFVLLLLQVTGLPTPPGSEWLYVATAAAWLLSLGGWVAVRAISRLLSRAADAVAAWFAPLRAPRKRRVIVVDAATGIPLPGRSPAPPAPTGWEWGAKRNAEFDEWSSTAARVKAMLRERERERERAGSTSPPWTPPEPPRAAAPPPPPRAEAPRPGAPPPRPRAAAPPRPPPPPPPRAPLRPDAWTVLGVARSASQDDIRQAYRDLVKQYHPDRVAGMPREFQAVAHEKTRELREAYEALKAPRHE